MYKSKCDLSSEDGHSRIDISRIVESDASVQRADALDFFRGQLEIFDGQVLSLSLWIAGFWND
jgi:hypothetical protein